MKANKYAIVDIETTGLSPGRDRITEIAIIEFDGEKITDSWHTLINPEKMIPPEITLITGISQSMVENAPKFEEIAKEIVERTQDRIFVAHNVHFDYGFIKHQFETLGFHFQRKTLCTVQLSKETFPGLGSYSLSSICKSLKIQNSAPHRALGDAQAAAELLQRIIRIGGLDPASFHLRRKYTLSAAAMQELEQLPEQTGIYYFYDDSGDVIYVGKSVNIRQRILQHLQTDNNKKDNILFKNSIAGFTYEITGSELVALLLEAHEIKTLQPRFNQLLKEVKYNAFIYDYYDRLGYRRLVADRARAGLTPLFSFTRLRSAEATLVKLVEQYNLCPKLCGIDKSHGACFKHQMHRCLGACAEKETPAQYNARVQSIINAFEYPKETFLLTGKGRNHTEKAVVLVLNGEYYGFGFVDSSFSFQNLEELKPFINHYPEFPHIRSIIYNYLSKPHPEKLIEITSKQQVGLY